MDLVNYQSSLKINKGSRWGDNGHLTRVDRPADQLSGDQQVSRGREMSQLPGLDLERTQPHVFSFLINKISNRGGTRYFETFRDENEILT